MYEIELKAHVYDKEKIIPLLHSFAEYRGKTVKHDEYWKQSACQNAGNTPDVRIRRENTELVQNGCRALVTCKHKKSDAALEINDEREFCVSDAGAFEYFIRQAGFSVYFTKRKECFQWYYKNVLIELCTVEGLGDFLELEIMSAANDEDAVKKARAKLQNILKKCGIPLAQIEPMYYSELLQQQRNITAAK